MSESLKNNEVSTNLRIPVETFEESVDRLRAEGVFTPSMAGSEDLDTAIGVLTLSDGSRQWSRVYSLVNNVERIDVNEPTNAALVEEGIQNLKTSTVCDTLAREARWWASDYANLAEASKEGVTDAVEITDGERVLDILNFSDTPLDDKEVIEFKDALQSVVALSKGKIFNRVAGVALLPAAHFPAGNAASFSTYGRILAVNIDHLREARDFYASHDDRGGRYFRYFDGKEPLYKIFIAHELGHSLDISSLGESEAMGINSNEAKGRLGTEVSGISAFQNKFGWNKYHTEPGDFIDKHYWQLDDAQASESRERPLTGYANEDPGEDFAETFGVMAAGGDVNSVPGRVRTVLQTIEQASGRPSENASALEAYYQGPSEGVKLKAKFQDEYKVALVRFKVGD